MVDPPDEEWEPENIPDADVLYYRVHRNDFRDGKPVPGAFRNAPKGVPSAGMSTNWLKYSTPEQARQGANQPPEAYGVVRLVAGDVRSLPEQRVEHTPDKSRNNRAHTDVFGDKNTQVRARLLDMYELLLLPDISEE